MLLAKQFGRTLRLGTLLTLLLTFLLLLRMEMRTFIGIEKMSLTIGALLVLYFRVAEPAAILVATVFVTPQSTFVPQFRMTNKALIFVELMLLTEESLCVTAIGAFGSVTIMLMPMVVTSLLRYFICYSVICSFGFSKLSTSTIA